MLPNYDPLSCHLICAAFDHAGYRALLIEETATTVVSSLRLNDGQCLPLSSIVQGVVETSQKYHLKPENTTIFIVPPIIQIACNFPQYPLLMKKLLAQSGEGFDKIQIFAGEFEMSKFSFEMIYDVYCAYLLGGVLRKLGCKVRPYEMIPGQTDRLIDQARQKLYRCFAQGGAKEEIFKEIVADFAKTSIYNQPKSRPKVAIIGDLYVRDNDIFNQQFISAFEGYGAEVIIRPFNYLLRLSADKRSHDLLCMMVLQRVRTSYWRHICIIC